MKSFKRLLKKDRNLNVNKIDIYLSRLSHIAQIGILLVAVIGYFYTVIPLYQKSLLDEQIAQKELELKTAKKALEENYTELRNGLVSTYIFHVGAACSGLMVRPEPFLELGQKPAPPLERYGKIFELDIKYCLVSRLNGAKKISRTLRKEDYSRLSQKVIAIGDRLEKMRSESKKYFHDSYNLAISNPETLESLEIDTYTSTTLKALQNHVSASDYQRAILTAKINQLLSKQAKEYADKIPREIYKIDEIQWH